MLYQKSEKGRIGVLISIIVVTGLWLCLSGCGREADKKTDDAGKPGDLIAKSDSARREYRPRYLIYEDYYTDKICIDPGSFMGSGKYTSVTLDNGEIIRPNLPPPLISEESPRTIIGWGSGMTDDTSPRKGLKYSFYPPRDEFTVTMERPDTIFSYISQKDGIKKSIIEIQDLYAKIAIRITTDSIVLTVLEETGFMAANASHRRIPKRLKGRLYRISIRGVNDYEEISSYFIDSLAAIGAVPVDLIAGDYHYFSVAAREEDGVLIDAKSKIPCLFFRFDGPYEVMRYRFKTSASVIPWGDRRLIEMDYFPDRIYYFFGRLHWNNVYDINTIGSVLNYDCEMFEYSQTGMFHVMLTTREKYRTPGMRLNLTCYEIPDGMVIQPEVQKSYTVYGDDYKYDTVCLVKQTSFFPPADSFNVFITEYGDTAKFAVKYIADSISITPLNETLLSCRNLGPKRLDDHLSWLIICPADRRAKDSLEIFMDQLIEFLDQGKKKISIMPEGYYPVYLFDSLPSIHHIKTGLKTNLVRYRFDYELLNPIIFFDTPRDAEIFIADLNEFRGRWKHLSLAIAWEQVGHKVLEL